MRPTIRFSKAGLAATGLFLLLAAGVFFWVFFVASKNPADSGESGILLLPFAMPWVIMMPTPWLDLLTGIGSILLNALILYLLFGGLRFRRADRSPRD